MTSIEALVDRQMKRRALAEQAAQEKAASGQPVFAPLRVITISRQAGSGGRKLAPHIASMLNFELIDRQILDLLIKNTGARERLINSLDERTQSGIDLWVEGVLTQRYVDRTEYAHLLAKTINILAENGNAVILGRAANIILGKRGGFHVRIVAPRDMRIANLMEYENLTLEAARKRIAQFDEERRKFYRDCFDADIDNPGDYHLMINTGKISLSAAAQTILTGWNSHLAEITAL
jgi:cytidylate kinase